MTSSCPVRIRARVRGAFAGLLLLLAGVGAFAAEEFPYDRELILDIARMGRVKRVPMLTVSPNGNATIKLWCKDAGARVDISGSAIKIEPGPLPDALPLYMSDGQCSPERMQADADMLATLAQINAWRREGSAVVLTGSILLRFRPATN